MQCRVEECAREARYKTEQLCQKHYFRLWRNGHTHLKKSRPRGGIYRYQDSRGYFYVRKMGHPLADARGCVWEHRFLYYEKVSKELDVCQLCETPVDWATVHIDHIDNDKSNNSLDNLRPLCRACNVYRDRPLTSGCKHIFTVGDLSMSAHHWASRDDVYVSGATIIRRRLKKNWSDWDCIYHPRITHQNTNTHSPESKYLPMDRDWETYTSSREAQ